MRLVAIGRKRRVPNARLIAQLEELLEKARNGELRSMAAALEYDDGYQFLQAGDIGNAERMIGELSLMTYELVERAYDQRS